MADALPDLSSPDALAKIGNFERMDLGYDTEQAMLLGVYKSQLATITSQVEGLVHSFDRECQVYVTGGGIMALEKHLPRNWKVVPDLVLRGVRAIGSELLGTVSS